MVEGPEWADTVRFDIAARPAATSSSNQLRLMLRALFADRFKLVVRAEKRESQVYFLTVDQKGHRLQPSKAKGPRRVQSDATGLAFEYVTMQRSAELPVSRARFRSAGLESDGPQEGALSFKLSILTGADTEEARKAAGSPTWLSLWMLSRASA